MRFSAFNISNVFFETKTQAAPIHGAGIFKQANSAFATPRHFECTRLITVEPEKAAIQRIATFSTGQIAARRRATRETIGG